MPIKIDLSKEIALPGGFKLRFEVALVGVVLLGASGLVIGVLWFDHLVLGFYYALLDFLAEQRFALFFAGALGAVLSFQGARRFSSHEGVRLAIGLVGVAWLLLVLAAVIEPWTRGAGRLGDRRVAVLRFADPGALAAFVDSVADDLDFQTTSVPSSRPELRDHLLAIKRQQFDVVLLDYPDPTFVPGEQDLVSLFNPRTLYISTGALSPDSPSMDNLMSLGPPLAQEIWGLLALSADPRVPTQLLRDDSRRAGAAATVVRDLFAAHGTSLLDAGVVGGRTAPSLEEGTRVLWLGWEEASVDGIRLPAGPALILPAESEPEDWRVYRLREQSLDGWQLATPSRRLALETILKAHFTDRPLDIRRSVSAAIDSLSNRDLSVVSFDLRLVPRYPERMDGA